MKDKKKDGEGGKPRDSRKNNVGSKSQSLMQAAGGSGFIGFSAFQTSSKSSPLGQQAGEAGDGKELARGDTKAASKGRVKTAKVDGRYSAGSDGQVLPPHYSGGDSHLAVVCKRLSKRDVTTKIKALAELRAMCRRVTLDADEDAIPPERSGGVASSRAQDASPDVAMTSAEALGGLAPHWVFLYQRLTTDGDRRTREAANATLLCMLRANRRAFQPLMRSLMGAWWCSQADTATEVSSSATDAFHAVFPATKRASVLLRCSDGVLRHIDSILQQTPAMMVEASGCTEEEAVDRAERLSVSALKALSNLMEALGEEANAALCHGGDNGVMTSVEDASQKQKDATYRSVINESLWTRLEDPRPAVRGATYALVSACCRHAQPLLRPNPSPKGSRDSEPSVLGGEGVAKVVGNPENTDRKEGKGRGEVGRSARVSRVSTPALLVGLLSEKEASNHREAWQAILLLLTEFKSWMTEKGAAMVLPTFLARLRKDAFLRTSGISYPCLLPFLASLSIETLLAPTDGKATGSPFCAALVETLWATVTKHSGSRNSKIAGESEGGGAGGWLSDVVCAHVECAVYLLLKLPPSGGGSSDVEGFENDGDEYALQRQDGVEAATANLARAVGSFVLGEEVGEAAGVEDTRSYIGGWLRREVKSAGGAATVSKAYSRALGQLHLGEKKGAGVMGSTGEAARVWGDLLEICKQALHERSEDDVRWTREILLGALSVIQGRQEMGDQGGEAADNIGVGLENSTKNDGGLRGLCRTLFHLCIHLISDGTGGLSEAKRGQMAVSRRDTPLVLFMSSLAEALGIEHIFNMRQEDPSSPTTTEENDEVVDIVGCDVLRPRASRRAATEHYESFLIPRLLASSAGDGTADGAPASASLPAFVALVKTFLSAESDLKQEEHFRFLLKHALDKPESVSLRTATTALHLAPRHSSGKFPEVEEALLRACGLCQEPSELGMSSSTSSESSTSVASSDLPSFLQACMGVKDGWKTCTSFISATVVSRIIHAALAQPGAASKNVAGGTLASADGSNSTGVYNMQRSVAMALLEGLLAVLAAGCPKNEDDVAEEDEALAKLRENELPLLLTVFAGSDDESHAERLWRDFGAPALVTLAASNTPQPDTTEEATRGSKIWRTFLRDAVEHIRRVMEGGEEDSEGGVETSLSPDRSAVEHGATLALKLVEVRSEALQLGSARYSARDDIPPESDEEDFPILWRLGLTRPSVWRERRLEALQIDMPGEQASAGLGTFARACVRSRWAQRWECLSAILTRIPNTHQRLEFFIEGVGRASASATEGMEGATAGGIVGVAGEALQEILVAGVLVERATRLLQGKGHLGLAADDGPLVDLPSGLLTPPEFKTTGEGASRGVPRGEDRGDDAYLNDFGVGLPSFRNLSAPGEGPVATVAATNSAEVVGAALCHLNFEKSDFAGRNQTSAEISGSNTQYQQPQEPFDLLLPHDLWRTAFIAPFPRLHGHMAFSNVAGKKHGAESFNSNPREGGGSARSRAVSSDEAGKGAVAPGTDRPTAEDVRLHSVLMFAFACAMDMMADGVTGVAFDGPDAFGAWLVSCLAEVSSGLLASVVGETFMSGLNLGDEAYRIMVTRCGVYDPSVPTAADLVPGARTLYTRDGQAVTILAAHVDPGGGEAYFTVAPTLMDGSTGPERQTVLDRLSLVLPPGSSSPSSQDSFSSTASLCPWMVKPRVSTQLIAVLTSPVLSIEQSLWAKLGRSVAGVGPEGPALVSAGSAALRGCASTCLRAALLCSSGTQTWDGVQRQVVAVRNRWASACVKSGSSFTVRQGEGGGRDSPEAAATVALSTAVLSDLFAATPLMPSKEEAMRLIPTRLMRVLSEHAASVEAGVTRDEPDHAWRRACLGSSLVWLRDAAEASCIVHKSPSPWAVSGGLFAGTHADAELSIIPLVKCVIIARRNGGNVKGYLPDLALARACAGLFAAEGIRVSRGQDRCLSSESKAAVVSWAVSKFLLSGSRVSAARTRAGARSSGWSGSDDDVALGLETARLLTAVAWHGRKGWRGDVSGSNPTSALVAGPRERSEVWEAARAPAIWRGLHAAVIGAVDSPILQLSAFEILEAAAAGWDCGSGASGEDKDDANSHKSGEVEAGMEEDASTDGGPTGGESIVSRLATALGGWGLGSRAGVDIRGEGVIGDGEVGEENSAERDETGAREDAVEDEAREQRDDLELIARCFPDDLLLAVEALPSTIDALAEESVYVRDGRRREDIEEEIDDMSPEEKADDDDVDDDVEDDVNDDLGDNAGDDMGNDVDDEGDATRANEVPGSDPGPPAVASETEPELEQPESINSSHQSAGTKSRRKRLRRRYSSSLANANQAHRGRTRRDPATGPSLTAPFLTWLLWLEHCRRASEVEGKARPAARAFMVRAGCLAPVMEACVRVLRASQGNRSREKAASSRLGHAQGVRVSRLDPRKPQDLARLALAVYFRTVNVFPALSRSWWADDCPRGLRVWVAEFTQQHVSPALIQIEAQIIANATERGTWDEGGDMTVRASATSRQVVASYVKEECTLEACIQLPPEYPLRSVEVTCTKRMGVSESRWRQWVLQIVTLLSLQDGSVLDAVMLWKKNVDKEFEGVEPCVICYGILHPRDMALPQMNCKICKNRFHSTCLYKWFQTSHKNKCPICQQTWA